MAVTGKGDFPLKSTWLSNPRRRSTDLLYKYVGIGGSGTARRDVWSDWFFDAAAGGTNVTVSGTTPAAILTQIARNVVTGARSTVSVQSLTSSIPAYASRIGARFNANVLNATFSIQGGLIKTGATVTANTLARVLSLPTASIRYSSRVDTTTQQIVATITLYSAQISARHTPSPTVITVTMPLAAVKINAVNPITTLTALFSLDGVLPKTGARVMMGTQEITLDTQIFDTLIDVVFTANTITLVCETGILERVGSAVWTFFPRNSSGYWSRRRIRYHDLDDNYE